MQRPETCLLRGECVTCIRVYRVNNYRPSHWHNMKRVPLRTNELRICQESRDFTGAVQRGGRKRLSTRVNPNFKTTALSVLLSCFIINSPTQISYYFYRTLRNEDTLDLNFAQIKNPIT